MLTIEQTDKLPTADGKNYINKYKVISIVKIEPVENPKIHEGDLVKMTLHCRDAKRLEWLCHKLAFYKDVGGMEDLEERLPDARYAYTSNDEDLTVTITYNIHDAARILFLEELISESAKNQITEYYKNLYATYLQQTALRYAEAVLSPGPAERHLKDEAYMKEQVIPLVHETLMKEGNTAIAGPSSPPVKAH
jgi:hypothetical protein